MQADLLGPSGIPFSHVSLQPSHCDSASASANSPSSCTPPSLILPHFRPNEGTKLTQRALHRNLALGLLLPLRHVALDKGLADGDLDAGRDAERGAAELGRAGCRRGEGSSTLLESRHEEAGECDDGRRGRRGSDLKDPPSAWCEHRGGWW